MARPSVQEKGFLDFLAAPLTLLPLGAGLSLFIVASVWARPEQKALLNFLGVVGVLLGLGLWLTQWLFSSTVPPLLAQTRQEFAASLEAACRMDSPEQPQEAKLLATPAAAEHP